MKEKLCTSLAQFKVPKYILEVEEIPKTTTGKIRSEELKAKAIEMIQER